jgi:Zn-dependent M28 family amino/carboxypeptidase
MSGEETDLAVRLRGHVQVLAGDIGDRNVDAYDNLNRAAGYIARCLGESGYAVTEQPFTAGGKTVRNLAAEICGAQGSASAILVIGAHYDSVPGCPAANDNASGVAAVLELARLMAGDKLRRTVRFVLFMNEEPPYFQTDLMGSLVYARACAQRRESIVGMMSLETIGYYSDAPGSQRYPFPYYLMFPSTGNYIAFVGDTGSETFVRDVVGSFRRHAQFPSEGVAAPASVEGVGWSDHWAFWQEGYPALMVTDTAPFRYPHYHEPTDTPDKLDYDRTARVTAGLVRVVREMAGTAEQ